MRIGPIFMMAEAFSGLASIPHSDTMNPRSMPRGTSKTYFSGFSLIPLALRHQKVLSRSATRPLAFIDLTMMLFMYASTVLPMGSPKT